MFQSWVSTEETHRTALRQISWITWGALCILLLKECADVLAKPLSMIFSSFHELMQSRGVRRPSVCPSVCKLFCANRYYHRSGWIATKLAHDGPQKSSHPRCAQGQGQGQRSRYTGTSVMSRNVCCIFIYRLCCTVRSDVLSLHALTLWNTIILSFQYKYQAAV